MQKTPDEIKKGLESCHESHVEGCIDCSKCPYGYVPKCKDVLHADAFALIRQLEDGVDRIYKQVDTFRGLPEEIEKIVNERDALLADLTLVCGSDTINPCLVCGHYRTDWEEPGCELNGLTCIWSWRGVKKDAG